VSEVQPQVKKLGSLVMAIFEFPEVGDLIPLHQHREGTSHIMVVSKGQFIVRGGEWEKIVSPGEILIFEPEQPHEIVASAPNGKIVNIGY
jgi:quercetin dioxygenase-like cupin family protein